VPVVIASTGSRRSISADRLTQEFTAVNVRDITTAISTYRTQSATVGDTTVRVYYRPGAPATALLTAAKAALGKLEARLGPYPYTILKIVQSAGGYGMEGPGVAWIPSGVGSSNLTYLVTHEIAHQWFYGVVGNDQAREPFADEAMTDFVARYVLGMRRASRCAAAPLDRSIYRYGSTCYYEQVYIQGGNLIDNARRKMGAAAFWGAVRGYISDHRWGMSHTKTLLDALDDATSLNLGSWWGSRFPTLY
jgi:aminopeptidase N